MQPLGLNKRPELKSLRCKTIKIMKQLTLEQRYKISASKSTGMSNISIAKALGVHKSTIGRELKRNKDQRNGLYNSDLAHKKATHRHKKKPKYIKFTQEIKTWVIKYIKKDFSPDQIVGTAKKEGIACVSRELIYQFIWANKKAGGELYTHLRTKGKRYANRANKNGRRGTMPDRVDISERPDIVEEKTRIGDLEINLVVGANHKGALLTINDRASGALRMAYVHSKEAKVVQEAAVTLLQEWKGHLHTITNDNGKEFSGYQWIANQLDIDYYFARPYHSWERGANENLNGL
jgi:transposase, IS30 family